MYIKNIFGFKDKKIFIKKKMFIKYLNYLGVYMYYPDDTNYVFVRLDGPIIDLISISKIKKLFFDRLESDYFAHQEKLIEKALNSVNSLFSKGLLETLPTIKPKFLKDTKDLGVMFYLDGFLLIKKTGIKPFGYNKLPGHIWKSQIIGHAIMEQGSIIKNKKSEFEVFIEKVSGGNPERKKALESIIGYLLHGYKDPSNPKAVILYDLPSNNDNPEGRRGKGIIVVAIEKFLKITKEYGKLFTTKGNFIFQQVDINTMILFFDDVPKEFDMIKLFSVVSEGISIEKKFQPKFVLNYANSPKVVITSNYLTKGAGDSYEGRRIEFGLSPYFSAKWTPKDEFEHLLFDDWDSDEWNRFNVYMTNLLVRYLGTGIISCKNSESANDRLAGATSVNFSIFCKENILIGEEFIIKELYSRFLSLFSDQEGFSMIKQHMFTKWLNLYSKYNRLSMSTRESNGKTLVTFAK